MDPAGLECRPPAVQKIRCHVFLQYELLEVLNSLFLPHLSRHAASAQQLTGVSHPEVAVLVRLWGLVARSCAFSCPFGISPSWHRVLHRRTSAALARGSHDIKG